MYVGNCTSESYDTFIYDITEGYMVYKTVDIPQAIERIFLEILTNAGDNVIRSRNIGHDPGSIWVTIDKDSNMVHIVNQGVPIPVVVHPEYGMYIPELIFGTLLSSSNYNQDRTGAGVNGLGAKLCNIMSTYFEVEVLDGYNRLRYHQIWKNHMTRDKDPDIVSLPDANPGDSYVSVKYVIDTNYFHYTYTTDLVYLFTRHCIDMSYNLDITIVVNDCVYHYYDPREYSRLYFRDFDRSIVLVGTNHKVVIVDKISPIEVSYVSFVNGVYTRDGGVHVNALVKKLADVVRSIVKYKVTSGDIRRYTCIVVSCYLKNPKFSGQSKTYLNGPTPTYGEISPDQLQEWSLIDRIQMDNELRLVKSTDGKKIRYVGIKKLEDANLAGTKNSQQCVLLYTEGNSAAAFATKLVSLIPDGRDYYGIYPGKGKLLNVMNATIDQIANNEEICNLKQVLGLKDGVDYTDDENYNSLRYGHFLIMSDSDVDGKHIIGLVLNFFHCRFPSLLYRGFVSYLRTPIIKVVKGKEVIRFYTQTSYDRWKDNTPDYHTYKHKYYKGLGTSNDTDINDIYNQGPKVIMCIYDESSPEYFRLAFDETRSNDRKKWIEDFKPLLDIEDIVYQPITIFLYHELTEFMISNVVRAIPKLLDGLKESQRKILWTAYMTWKGRKGWSNDLSKDIKVNDLASSSTRICGYKHGEKIMAETIAQMAHDFVGSNNMPYFIAEGQLGTRNQGGKDASDPRYTYVRPNVWIPLVFRNEDFDILDRVIDEGIECEPISFLPVIPMCLVNGVIGIGSGYSTLIPSYNPLDLIRWIRCKIRQEPLPKLIPWYRGFSGEIKLVDNYIPQPVDVSDDDPLGPDHIVVSRTSMVTVGKYHMDPKGGGVWITELPIKRFTHPYKEWLDDMVSKKKIYSYRNLSTHDKVLFQVIGMDSPDTRKLRLERTFGLGNMVLLDLNNRPKRYDTVDSILEEYYNQRLYFYQKRKDYIIQQYTDRIQQIEGRYKFVILVIEGKIVVMNQKKDHIIDQMRSYGIDPELLKVVKLSELTHDEAYRLYDEIQATKKELSDVMNTRPEDLWIRDLDDLERVLV
jgi:DNA topoisomerase-2